MRMPGSGRANSPTNSHPPRGENPSTSSVAISSRWGVSAATLAGEKTRLSSLRYRVWTGGSVRCNVGVRAQPRSARRAW